MKKTGTGPADARTGRNTLTRLRTAAAGSVLAAASITGAGAAAAPAHAVAPRTFLSPLALPPPELPGPDGTPGPGGRDRDGTPGPGMEWPAAAERLLGIRTDLANAVAWGTVTQAQADAFYAQIQARIARGL